MSEERLRVLSFTTVYPRPEDPRFGIFVRARLQHLAELADVRVVSPMAAVYYGMAGKRLMGLKGIAGPVRDGKVMVEYPRWVYPPGMGWAHGWWLRRFAQGTVERVWREFPFDVIDAHFGHPEASAAWGLARRFGAPFTVTLRGNETAHGKDPRKRQRMALALRAAARVIAVSGPLRDFAIELGARPDRAVVIPNGIDAEVFHPRDRAAERARLGMGDGELHILSAGYL
ncbi:MAG: glycosyltransferase, partial [Bryobacteraceae bacterium]|nr:glycosyltransferase [Bryobacteraceae bacterium]